MAVYTKTGDRGMTGTFSGKRILKSSKLINAIGAIDELNSYLGIIGNLTEIQRNLFTINSILSGANLKFSKEFIKELEKEIDAMEGKLPVLSNFIIYSGCKKSRDLYFARALVRRAERSLVTYYYKSQTTNHEPLVFLNRLSDYLFTLARYTNFKKNIKEKVWKIE